jgi:hypothetical protein
MTELTSLTPPSPRYNHAFGDPIPPARRTHRRLGRHKAALVKAALSVGCTITATAYAAGVSELTIIRVRDGLFYRDVDAAPVTSAEIFHGPDAGFYYKALSGRPPVLPSQAPITPVLTHFDPSTASDDATFTAGRLIGALMIAITLLTLVALAAAHPTLIGIAS